MQTQKRLTLRALALASAFLAGCFTSSIDGDVAHVASSSATSLSILDDVEDEPDLDDALEDLLRRPLDADAAVRVALLGNNTLRARLRELGVARGQLVQAGLIDNPTVEVEALPERDAVVELRVEYAISSLVLAPLRADVAVAELEAARNEVAADVVALGFRVRAAFVALQAAQRRHDLARDSVAAYSVGQDLADAVLEAGNINTLDAGKHKVAYERAQITAARLAVEVVAAREQMNRLLGDRAARRPWTLAGELAAPPKALRIPRDAEDKVVAASLELAAANHRVEAAARRTRLSSTEGHLPHTSVDVHVLHTRPEDRASGPGWLVGGGVSLDLPVFDRAQGTTRANTAQQQGLAERRDGLDAALRSRTRQAVAKLRAAHRVAARFRTVLIPAQRELLDQTLLQYNAMQLDLFQLLAARRDVMTLELDYVDALRGYWTASFELAALLRGATLTLDEDSSASATTQQPESRGDH